MVLVSLELLERVFLRLGAAESDDQLEKVLGRFLVPVILKITSEHKTVQNKVLLLHLKLPLLAFISLSLPPSLFRQSCHRLYMCTATPMNFDLCTLTSPTPGPGVIDPCEQEIEESASGAAPPGGASHTFQRPSSPTTSCRKL